MGQRVINWTVVLELVPVQRARRQVRYQQRLSRAPPRHLQRRRQHDGPAEASWCASCHRPCAVSMLGMPSHRVIQPRIGSYRCSGQLTVSPARSVACDDATFYSVSSRTPEHEAPCARPASAVGRRHRHQNQGPAFGTGHVLSASSNPVDDVGVTRRLSAGARRHAQQLGHASPKRPIAHRAAATARPSSKVESSEFSDVGSGSRGTRRTPGTAAIAPWGRAQECVVISDQTLLAPPVKI